MAQGAEPEDRHQITDTGRTHNSMETKHLERQDCIVSERVDVPEQEGEVLS